MSLPRTTLDKERQIHSVLYTLSSIAFVSGLVILFVDSFSYWAQINSLFHVLVSGCLIIPLLIYLKHHIGRTLSARQLGLLFSGICIIILVTTLFVSGFSLSYFGQRENQQWLSYAHTFSAYALVGFFLFHVIQSIFSKKRRKNQKNELVGKKLFIGKILVSLALYGFSIFSIDFTYEVYNTPVSNKKSDYLYAYGEHPFRPSQTETDSGNFISNKQIAKSNQCAGCHLEIYKQWLSSTHRQAASDPAYVKNINLLESNRGIAATRYCEGCHAPVALLTGELTPGGKHGGVKGTAAHLEGVGCMGCHGINKVVHLNGVASYEFSPKESYIFENSDNVLGQRIRNFLIRNQPSQHKKNMGSGLMQDPKLCATCHEQFMDQSMNNWGWVKMQSEYNDWLKSPFSGKSEDFFKTDTPQTCQNCHFPLVAGKDPSQDNNGMIHSHRSLGANTVLPFLAGDLEQLEATTRFLQTAKVLIDIEEPSRADAIQGSLFVDSEFQSENRDNTPFFLYLGEQTTLKVAVTNRFVGHNFPAGTTDINQAWIHFKVKDADDHVIFESGGLNDNLELDRDAHIYHSVPVDKTGKTIWKHDLFRMTGDTYKNIIPSGKTDIKEYSFTVPNWVKEPLTVSASLKYRKFNQRYAKWVLEHPRPELPIVNMARDALVIPLRVKPVLSGSPKIQ